MHPVHPCLLPLLALVAAACAAEVPTAFRADSPANPGQRLAPRMSVAAVLDAKDPVDAAVCPESAPCALPAAKDDKTPDNGEGHGHHHHHHHHH
jgi:hypothetical protein